MRIFVPILMALVATGSGYAQFGLGKLKRALDTAQKVSEMSITEEDEIALGERVSANIRAHFGVVQDAGVTRYVTLAGLVLAQHGSRPNLEYHFIVLDSNTINAFAAPGGYIHITRGALAAMKDEAELAGVLGHEITHVTERHTLEGIKKAKGLEIAQGETLRGSPAVMDKLADSMSDAILAGFGRKEELESDKIGVVLASESGYDPNGLIRFLEVLKAVNEGSNSKAGLFASHPETDERIKKLAKQIAKQDLARSATARLPERYKKNVQFEFVETVVEDAGVAEARGVGSGSGKKDKKGSKKRKGGFLSKLSNPLGSGEKEQRAEVTGTGAGRGVGAEGKEEEPAVVEDTDQPKTKKKKKGGFLSKLSNPLGSGEKEQRAEVTGTGAGRGVGSEEKEKEAGTRRVKTAKVVKIKVTPADVAAFKKQGNLR